MRARTRQLGLQRHMRASTGFLAQLTIATLVLTAAGCEEEMRNVGKRPQTRALEQTGVSLGFDEESRPVARPQSQQPQPKPKRPTDSGPIIGQRTQQIQSAAVEQQKGGARTASTKITAKDYISLQGNAYVTIIGRTSILKIQQALDLYHATNDRYPKDLDEFMNEIIKANNIALPKLPPYQAYGYDEAEHKLVILEYQALKDQPLSR
ncbi:MAG: hypothetical protein ACLQIB_40860 [Isosphaeraceae bacterium]